MCNHSAQRVVTSTAARWGDKRVGGGIKGRATVHNVGFRRRLTLDDPFQECLIFNLSHLESVTRTMLAAFTSLSGFSPLMSLNRAVMSPHPPPWRTPFSPPLCQPCRLALTQTSVGSSKSAVTSRPIKCNWEQIAGRVENQKLKIGSENSNWWNNENLT